MENILNPSTTQGAILCGVIGSIVASILVSMVTSTVVTKRIINKRNEKVSAIGKGNKIIYKSEVAGDEKDA